MSWPWVVLILVGLGLLLAFFLGLALVGSVKSTAEKFLLDTPDSPERDELADALRRQEQDRRARS